MNGDKASPRNQPPAIPLMGTDAFSGARFCLGSLHDTNSLQLAPPTVKPTVPKNMPSETAANPQPFCCQTPVIKGRSGRPSRVQRMRSLVADLVAEAVVGGHFTAIPLGCFRLGARSIAGQRTPRLGGRLLLAGRPQRHECSDCRQRQECSHDEDNTWVYRPQRSCNQRGRQVDHSLSRNCRPRLPSRAVPARGSAMNALLCAPSIE